MYFETTLNSQNNKLEIISKEYLGLSNTYVSIFYKSNFNPGGQRGTPLKFRHFDIINSKIILCFVMNLNTLNNQSEVVSEGFLAISATSESIFYNSNFDTRGQRGTPLKFWHFYKTNSKNYFVLRNEFKLVE